MTESQPAAQTAEELGFEIPEETAVPAPEVSAQLKYIAKQTDEWLGNPERAPHYEYAVTDLDQDGYLEIIQACTAGAGVHSFFEIREITAGGTEKKPKMALALVQPGGSAQDSH